MHSSTRSSRSSAHVATAWPPTMRENARGLLASTCVEQTIEFTAPENPQASDLKGLFDGLHHPKYIARVFVLKCVEVAWPPGVEVPTGPQPVVVHALLFTRQEKPYRLDHPEMRGVPVVRAVSDGFTLGDTVLPPEPQRADSCENEPPLALHDPD